MLKVLLSICKDTYKENYPAMTIGFRRVAPEGTDSLQRKTFERYVGLLRNEIPRRWRRQTRQLMAGATGIAKKYK